jgi:hypothetical protein
MEVPGGSAAYIEQSMIIPVNPGRLTFRTWGDLEPVTATLSIVDGPAVHRLLSFMPPGLRASPGSCSHRQPITESVNMARYAGQNLGIRIQATARGVQGAIADFDAFQLTER